MGHAELKQATADAVATSAELVRFPVMAQALVARLPLLTLLAGFQRGLNEEFDNCRHGARYRPRLAPGRLRSGVELLCQLEEALLHPALGASRQAAWPALGLAMASVGTLRDLMAVGERSGDAQQLALVTLLEGLVQLHFVSLDELLAQADVTAMPWAELERETHALLMPWQADSRDTPALEALPET